MHIKLRIYYIIPNQSSHQLCLHDSICRINIGLHPKYIQEGNEGSQRVRNMCLSNEFERLYVYWLTG